MLDLEELRSHLYAHGVAFIASRHYAAVVVGQHDDRLPLQIRTEDAFA